MSITYTFDKLDQIPRTPKRFAVLGYPVRHSLSPPMQEAAFQAAGIDASYVKIEVTPNELPQVVAWLKAQSFDGWNVTLPHKTAMLELVDHLAPSAQSLQAVNTVLQDDGQWIGFNTDGDGWVRAVRDAFGVDVRDLRILILGAGGVGRALALQAASEKCPHLVVVNRTLEKAQALQRDLMQRIAQDKLHGAVDPVRILPWNEDLIDEALQHIDLLVNATSVGLKAYDPPVLNPRLLTPYLMVYDTIYRPAETRLLTAAREAGARTANGLGMLLHQGALSWEIWTGKKAPLGVMRDALNRAAAAEEG